MRTNNCLRLAASLLFGIPCLPGCYSAPPKRIIEIPDKFSHTTGWDIGHWARCRRDFPEKGEREFIKTLVAKDSDGAEWWEIEIKGEDESDFQVVALIRSKELQIVKAYFSKAGEEARPVPTQRSYGKSREGLAKNDPSVEAFELAEEAISKLSPKPVDLRHTLAQMQKEMSKDEKDSSIGVSAVEEDRLESVKGERWDTLRVDIEGGQGPVGLKVSMWFSPDIPGAYAKTQARAYLTLLPIATITDEILDFGKLENPQPKMKLPEGAWPPKISEPTPSSKPPQER